MARPVSEHVEETYRRLIERLADGMHAPGQRFLSNRSIAEQYHVSYQTADRLVRRMVDAGLLVRRPQSGTFVAGAAGEARASTAALFFARRARRASSFGARLLELLRERLLRAGIEPAVQFVDAASLPRLGAGLLPVIWECPRLLADCEAKRRRAVVLNDRPTSGVARSFIDSIGVDDASGGASAAQRLVELVGADGLVIVAGPRGDKRSDDRVRGFRSVTEPARTLHAHGWGAEDGAMVAPAALAAGVRGVFCCNDRLAEAVLLSAERSGRRLPRLIGFDDAPIAARLGITTLAIPWDALVGEAVDVVRERLRGTATPAVRRVVSPTLLVRRT